ncbi:MAG: glutamate--tRNA ligase [Gammaproteobacteria bacterium]|nr:glutamate--tRNA ligase [Gammaproteobacteria bacterium]
MRSMKSLTKTRFAPSPTGLLHIGNLRTALFNVLYARQQQGVFLLRCEDTDPERSKEAFLQALMADLRWLGMDWQEGPEVGGELGPYRQSERSATYDTYYQQLEEADHAYPCFCSPEELALSRKAQRSAGLPPRYSGKCAHLSASDRQQRLDDGRQPTLRFRVSNDSVTEFEDLVRGSQAYSGKDIGDFIIRRADGSPAFFFANALDDALMQVNCVLRGEDHITNTPRQLMILNALGLPKASYGHTSLILGQDGQPLSKRNGSRSLKELREMGYFPIAILNHLARLGHHYRDESLMSLQQLSDGFQLSSLGKAPARHDEFQLNHWQKLALAAADDGAVLSWLEAHAPEGAVLRERVPAALLADFIGAVRANIAQPAEAYHWAEQFFSDSMQMSEDAQKVLHSSPTVLFETALALLPEAADFRSFAKAVGKSAGVKGKGLFMPLRAALSGEVHGPEMGQMFPLLGQARVEQRLQQALRLAKIGAES